MKNLVKRAGSLLRRLHRDEQGADMIEYILIVAAVALPLLGVVIWYWHDISIWAYNLWQGTKQGSETDPANIQHTS